jgi:hypothetical protein
MRKQPAQLLTLKLFEDYLAQFERVSYLQVKPWHECPKGAVCHKCVNQKKTIIVMASFHQSWEILETILTIIVNYFNTIIYFRL